MQSCETAFELLERYAAMSQTNHTWIDVMNDQVGKLPLENGQLESTAVRTSGGCYLFNVLIPAICS